MNDAVLCYVYGNWAYFTTQNLSHQWGDDWNDAPYEYNAGCPYRYGKYDAQAGKQPWAIVKVAFDGNFVAPSEGYNNSPWSVQQINEKAVAWLKPIEGASIFAGVTVAEFIRLIDAGGGHVYLPINAVPAVVP
jgi:hypothetical protein